MRERKREDQKSQGARSYHHGDLQRVIVETTLDLLRDRDVDAVSIREVARRAGVSPQAPYRHFPGKNSLLAAVAAVGFERLRDRTASLPLSHPGENLELETAAYVGFALEEPALFRLMFSGLVEGPFPHLHAVRDEAYAALRARAAAAVPKVGDLEGLLLAHWSLMHGLASLVLDGKLEHKHLGAPEVLARRAVRAILASRGTD